MRSGGNVNQARPARTRHSDQSVWCSLLDQVRHSELAPQLHSIAFDVRDGRVVLSGQLHHRHDITRLVCLAWNVPGVATVTDRLHYCGEPLDLRSETRPLQIRR
jgi:osmotically-inducible protein OsmY